MVEVNGIICRALPDTGAGSSYMSSTLACELKKPPIRTDYKQIETMLHTTNGLIDIYDVEITNTKDDSTIDTEVSKVDRAELISMPNSHYEDIIQTNTHLQGVQIEDSNKKEFLLVYVILEASEYASIKTERHQSWAKRRQEENQQLLNTSAEADYAELCNLDVMRLKEGTSNMDSDIDQRFKDQLGRNKKGCYETNIMCKQFTPAFPSNETGSLGRLGSLTREMRKDPKLPQ